MYYFVAYQLQINNNIKICNIILKDVHPLIWISMPRAKIDGVISHVIFWSEIPKDIALNKDVGCYIPTNF